MARVKAKLSLYPNVIDPRTSNSIRLPDTLGKIAKEQRVSWGTAQRDAFKNERVKRGFEIPKGGWNEYDIHHIIPREFGGRNDFWNLVPVLKSNHKLFNQFWRLFGDL